MYNAVAAAAAAKQEQSNNNKITWEKNTQFTTKKKQVYTMIKICRTIICLVCWHTTCFYMNTILYRVQGYKSTRVKKWW